MKKKRMKWLISLLLILCIIVFAVFFFCNDHSQQQFEEEEASVSVAVPDISQAEGETQTIEDERKEIAVFISDSPENNYDVLIPES